MEEADIKMNGDLFLNQHKEGFSFGTDALLLSAFLRRKKCKTAVELGCGSGAVSLLAFRYRAYEKILCIDVQEEYTAKGGLTEENARRNGVEDRLLPLCCDLRTLTARDIGGEVEVVFANPPYYALEAGRPGAHTVREIARREVFGGIADFCACAGRLLQFGGSFSLVYCPERLTDLLWEMRKADLEPKRVVLVQKDADHPPFAVLAEGKKGAMPGCKTEVLTLFAPDGTPTPAYEAIRTKGEWIRS